MNQELPRIVCQKCHISQTYNGQANCTSCGQRLNNWSVASQLMIKKYKDAKDSEK